MTQATAAPADASAPTPVLALAEGYARVLTQQDAALVASGVRSVHTVFGVDESGRDYLRIFRVIAGQRTIVCFVDRVSGDVFRARSWKQRGARVGVIGHVLGQFQTACAAFEVSS